MWKRLNREINVKYPVPTDSGRPGPAVAVVAHNTTLSSRLTVDIIVILLNTMKLRPKFSDRDGSDANEIAGHNLFPTRPLRGPYAASIQGPHNLLTDSTRRFALRVPKILHTDSGTLQMNEIHGSTTSQKFVTVCRPIGQTGEVLPGGREPRPSGGITAPLVHIVFLWDRSKY